jgi:phosphoenolpyruvate carboxykinase (GTP)
VQAIHGEEWRQEVLSQSELFLNLHATLPKELAYQRELLVSRL